jgi:hypothetical protein
MGFSEKIFYPREAGTHVSRACCHWSTEVDKFHEAGNVGKFVVGGKIREKSFDKKKKNEQRRQSTVGIYIIKVITETTHG